MEEENKIDEADLFKEVNQLDSIDHNKVQAQMDEMAFIWGELMTKIKDDNCCAKCQQVFTLKDDKPVMFLVKAADSAKGFCTFAAVCDTCYQEINKKV